jgi:hypothetical protein
MACWGLAELVAAAASAEPPWREPGQVKDAEYLRSAKLRYSAEGREIVGRNRTCFNNRPLYCQPHDTGFVLTGDRPLVRLIDRNLEAGVWAGAIVRDGAGKWFHEYAEVESRYRCGRMAWRVSDPVIPGVEVEIEALPLNGAAGFALRLRTKGARAGDKLVWSLGGARSERNPRDRWDPVMCGNPNVRKTGDPRKPETRIGLVPAACAGSQVQIDGQTFRLLMKPDALQAAVGTIGHAGTLRAADASACAEPAKLAASSADKLTPHPLPAARSRPAKSGFLCSLQGCVSSRCETGPGS